MRERRPDPTQRVTIPEAWKAWSSWGINRWWEDRVAGRKQTRYGYAPRKAPTP